MLYSLQYNKLLTAISNSAFYIDGLHRVLSIPSGTLLITYFPPVFERVLNKLIRILLQST